MNDATKKLDELIPNWKPWAKEMGFTKTLENLDEQSMEKVMKHLNNMKQILEQRGYESAYFKGLKEGKRCQ